MKRRDLIAGIGLLACVPLLVLWPKALAEAWLTAAAALLGLPLGALAILFTHALTGGRWGVAAGPALRRIAILLPLAMLGFLLLVPALPAILPLSGPLVPRVAAKVGYLQPGWIAVRTFAVFAAWLGVWWTTLRRPVIPRPVAIVGLALYMVGLLLLSTDWMLALEPDYVSTIYPPLVASAQITGALALAILLTPASRCDADFGKLLIAAMLTWVYMAFMQWLVTFMGNLPTEAQWYLRRSGGPMLIPLGAMIVLFGIVPFLALLPQASRSDPRRLRTIAGVVLAGYLMENLWRLGGAFEPTLALLLALVATHALFLGAGMPASRLLGRLIPGLAHG